MSDPTKLVLCMFFALPPCSAASAQQMMFRYKYEFEPAMITERPEIGGLEFDNSDAARKNGGEGNVRVSMTLGGDGKLRAVKFHNDLGHGTNEAIDAGLRKFDFKPAKFNGKPAPMNMSVS